MKQLDLPNSEIINRINEHIHSERDREILRLRFVDGYTYERIAEAVEMSTRQIKTIVGRYAQKMHE